MKKIKVFLFVTALILLIFVACSNNVAPPSLSESESPRETQIVPAEAPLLDVSFITDNLPIQCVQAAQLTTSWFCADEDGNGRGYEADSPHPLQLRDYSGITLFLENTNGEFEIQFSDNYPPQSVSVQRWDAVYAGIDSTDAWDKGEPVAINGNRFRIENDECNYVYMVSAKWENGNSSYAFRTDNSSE